MEVLLQLCAVLAAALVCLLSGSLSVSCIALSVCIFCLIGISAVFRLMMRQRIQTLISYLMHVQDSLELPDLTKCREDSLGILHSEIYKLVVLLNEQSQEASKGRRYLTDMLSNISHQLKTPLAAMILYQEILSDEPEHPDTVREFSMKMGTALKRMERLILSMLKITRLDTGNITFERRICSVSELISHSVRDLLERARQEEKEIRITGNPDLTLNCDLAWTSEAIGNLVKNALDHTRKGGLIRVSWEQTPAVLQLVISDDGSGIAPEDIHHIFKRFYRSKNSLDTEGIGLGLPLAKSILEGQGGLISCQSDPGRGTSFILSFLTKP